MSALRHQPNVLKLRAILRLQTFTITRELSEQALICSKASRKNIVAKT